MPQPLCQGLLLPGNNAQKAALRFHGGLLHFRNFCYHFELKFAIPVPSFHLALSRAGHHFGCVWLWLCVAMPFADLYCIILLSWKLPRLSPSRRGAQLANWHFLAVNITRPAPHRTDSTPIVLICGNLRGFLRFAYVFPGKRPHPHPYPYLIDDRVP